MGGRAGAWFVRPFSVRCIVERKLMDINKLVMLTWFSGTLQARLFLAFFLIMVPMLVKASEVWLCTETAYFSIYEDVKRTEMRERKAIKHLRWIDMNTIGFDAITHRRNGPKSDTFTDQNTESAIYINDKEMPYMVVLTQPQVWMNKFGNLRLRFFRCSP